MRRPMASASRRGFAGADDVGDGIDMVQIDGAKDQDVRHDRESLFTKTIFKDEHTRFMPCCQWLFGRIWNKMSRMMRADSLWKHPRKRG